MGFPFAPEQPEAGDIGPKGKRYPRKQYRKADHDRDLQIADLLRWESPRQIPTRDRGLRQD